MAQPRGRLAPTLSAGRLRNHWLPDRVEVVERELLEALFEGVRSISRTPDDGDVWLVAVR